MEPLYFSVLPQKREEDLSLVILAMLPLGEPQASKRIALVCEPVDLPLLTRFLRELLPDVQFRPEHLVATQYGQEFPLSHPKSIALGHGLTVTTRTGLVLVRSAVGIETHTASSGGEPGGVTTTRRVGAPFAEVQAEPGSTFLPVTLWCSDGSYWVEPGCAVTIRRARLPPPEQAVLPAKRKCEFWGRVWRPKP